MTYPELAREIKALPRSRRLELMEVIIETLLEEEQPPVRADSSLQRLSGIAKSDGPAPTDEEIEQIRAQYLIEKYS